MRPPSYREQIPERRCENCRHALAPRYKDDLLCFCGDVFSIVESDWGDGTAVVKIGHREVGLMDGDDYDKVWGGRVVDATDICDEWEGRSEP